jgi:hypothetical protein
MNPSDIPTHYDTTLDKIARHYSEKLSERYYINHLYGYLPANGEEGGYDYKQMQVSPNSFRIMNFFEKHVNVGMDTTNGIMGGYGPRFRIPYSDPNFEQSLHEAIDKELNIDQIERPDL